MKITEHNFYSSSMRKLPDLELIEIITVYRNEYHHEAISAAKAELRRRNITIDDMEELIGEAESEYEMKQYKAELNLPVMQKVLCFIMPWRIGISLRLEMEGYITQAKEVRLWCSLGFIGMMLILWLTTYLHFIQ